MLTLAGEHPDGGRDGAVSDAGDLTEQAAPIETAGAQPLGDGEYHLPVRYGRAARGVEPDALSRRART